MLTPPSRRSFLRFAGLSVVTLPFLTEQQLAYAALPQQNSGTTVMPKPQDAAAAVHRPRTVLPPGAVKIDANENPLGPAPVALAAIASSAVTGGRYDQNGYVSSLTDTFSKQNGIPADHIAVYAGSTEPLNYSIMAFTAPGSPFITADPSYDGPLGTAAAVGAPVIKLPLTPTYGHDARAMVAAAKQTGNGLMYICNPNNPTGTLTPREDILYALENKPKGTVLLVDEAYIHLSSSPSVIDQVVAGKDIIVLRTFSKVYGMAGIRCGFAVARPDLLARLQHFGMNSMPITAAAAANASLLDASLVPARKKIIADTRNQTFAFLTAKGYKFIPSESNCFMIDTGRPGKQVIEAMRAQNVYIGRIWPVWPTSVRITVGTPDEMAKFEAAFQQVMSA